MHMTWNYRVVAFPEREGPYLRICEVFYGIDGDPASYSEAHPLPSGCTYEDLQEDLRRMEVALMLPAIDVALLQKPNEH